MTLVRAHRGGLAESLATAQPVEDLAGLVRSIQADLGRYEVIDPASVKVEPYGGFDKRCGWDTYIVTVNGDAWGFTNGPLT